jgi:hypothetical protein
VITSIMLDDKEKARDRLTAADRILSGAGLGVRDEKHIHVTISDSEMVKEIRLLAGQLGLDARQLLGNASVVIEHEDEPK